MWATATRYAFRLSEAGKVSNFHADRQMPWRLHSRAGMVLRRHAKLFYMTDVRITGMLIGQVA